MAYTGAKKTEYMREWREKNKDSIRAYNRKTSLKVYGITPIEYAELLLKQDGVCAICKQPSRQTRGRSLAVDHDHRTGKVRGLLCNPCNLTLGKMQDDPSLLRNAAEYLERSE